MRPGTLTALACLAAIAPHVASAGEIGSGAPPKPAVRSEDVEQKAAADLLAARQENARRQHKGAPSVWMLLPPQPRNSQP
ncbi:hypothetical protein MOX02_41720 [Methylobacterium oxalidis]|uniref:Uncharacterized protein n=1 Tax=Methylobacterium oxalidis TaxID=944322 RepID=A0A512J839_9HYPH|nr:hypothetical protein MOX02_41720 [Methylobacterium oxalidis]GLS65153.1 hypothetical protein GCM10007888_35350 [Methylobacterium oxalidis]